MRPMKCINCEARTERTTAEVCRNIAGHAFLGRLPAFRCPKCSEVYYDGPALGQFELKVALELAQRGMVSGPAFKFMRKALGMRATELAGLLNVAPETLSRWETEQRDLDHAAWTALASLVADRAEGRDRVISMLRAIADEKPQPKSIRVEVDVPATRTGQ